MRLHHVIVLLGVCIGACSARPNAELVLVEGPEDLSGKEVDLYAFPHVFISVDRTSDKDKAGDGAISLKVFRKNYESWRIGIQEKKEFGVRTNLNLKKTDNTDLIEEVGVQVFDDRVKMIGSLGEIAGMLLRLAGSGLYGAQSTTEGELERVPDKPQLPYVIDTVQLMTSLSRDGSSAPLHDPVTWDKDNNIRYWFGPVSPDAREVSKTAIRSVEGGLVYAGCRNLVLHYPGTRETWHMAVPDPRYFRVVKFPQKGKIVFASDCGVSITSEKDDSAAADTAVLREIVKQLGDLKEQVRVTKPQ